MGFGCYFENDLVAAIEVKSQVGSFGNNFNNRVEEALGNATDFWARIRKVFSIHRKKPWLGYIFMLEEYSDSLSRASNTTLAIFR